VIAGSPPRARGSRCARAALLAVPLLLAVGGCGAGIARGPGASPRTEELAPRNLQIQLEERFYSVSGRSARQLNRALSFNGPRAGGRPAHALTEWHLDWSYRQVRSGSRCASARPTVTVGIVTTLPRWTDLANASASLVDDWALFLARLRDHESTHQYLALEGGRELLRTLEALEAPSCDLLELEAERVVRRLEMAYEEQQLRFDEASEYGRRLIP
jgi:predicted secreted Zn-dependent protease